MMHKITFGLLAAAALVMSALTPTAASAHGGHWFGFHHHFGFYGVGPVYVGDDSCLVRQVIETRHGPRVRLVNVCGY